MNLKKLYGIDDKFVKRSYTQCINGFYFGKIFNFEWEKEQVKISFYDKMLKF